MDSEGFTQNGKQKTPSRFLKEIGEENYIRVGSISKELQECIDHFSSSSDKKTMEKILTVGKKVTHPAFGDGEIAGYGKNGNSYIVKFSKLESERVLSKEFFEPERSSRKTETSNNIPANTEKHITHPEFPKEPSDLSKAGAKEIDAPKKLVLEEQNDEYKRVEDKIVPEMIQKQIQTPSYNETPSERNSPECNNTRERDDIPKEGWKCTGVTDLGAATGFCQYCGQTIRYVHHMYNPGYSSMNVGCICAGKLEGDIERAKLREQEYKNKQARRENFKKRKWKKSKNNNRYVSIKNHLIVLYYSARNDNWKYSIDNKFSIEVFSTRDEAMDGAFEALETKLQE